MPGLAAQNPDYRGAKIVTGASRSSAVGLGRGYTELMQWMWINVD